MHDTTLHATLYQVNELYDVESYVDVQNVIYTGSGNRFQIVLLVVSAEQTIA